MELRGSSETQGCEKKAEGRASQRVHRNRARFQRMAVLEVGRDRRANTVGNGTESRVGVVRGAIRSRYTRRRLRNGVLVRTNEFEQEGTDTATNRRILDALPFPRETSSSNCIASSSGKSDHDEDTRPPASPSLLPCVPGYVSVHL